MIRNCLIIVIYILLLSTSMVFLERIKIIHEVSKSNCEKDIFNLECSRNCLPIAGISKKVINIQNDEVIF